MRKLVIAVFAVVGFAAVGTGTANATSTSSRLSLTAKITHFRATSHGVIADGTLSGRLRSGGKTSRASAPVKFKAVAKPHNGRCDVLTLHLAPLDLELLGVQVKTSTINLDVYAIKGRILGDLFCALSHAKVSFPKAARDARTLNAHLGGHAMRVFSSTETLPGRAAASQPQSCQVLKLVLGPLHLDLLGLVVDLYGATHHSPVIVQINAQPNKGLLGQLLCSLAGGTSGVTSVSGLQNLLSTLGVNLSITQIQNLLNQLGISLNGGLTQLNLNKILQALGLGSTTP